MKRRGFLGFLAGGAVAGPSMAKQAVSATMADMSLSGVAVSGMGMLSGDVPSQAPDDYNNWASRMAKLAIRSRSEHQERQRQMYCNALDPDLVIISVFRPPYQNRDAETAGLLALCRKRKVVAATPDRRGHGLVIPPLLRIKKLKPAPGAKPHSKHC